MLPFGAQRLFWQDSSELAAVLPLLIINRSCNYTSGHRWREATEPEDSHVSPSSPWAPTENSIKLLCSFLAKIDPSFFFFFFSSVGVLLLETLDLILIVMSLPLPLSIPPPSSFLSLASFSQTSSEPTHHTDLGISCKLMFSRCSSCLTR